MGDGRKANNPTFQPNPKKEKSRKSSPYQFRLHPDDEFELKFKKWIAENKQQGWSVRGLMKELFRQYTDSPQPMQVDPDHLQAMQKTLDWIAEQFASGATFQPAGKKGKAAKSVELPSNIKTVIDHFRERGPAKRDIVVDED